MAKDISRLKLVRRKDGNLYCVFDQHLRVLRALKKNGEQTVAQLSKSLPYPSNSIARYAVSLAGRDFAIKRRVPGNVYAYTGFDFEEVPVTLINHKAHSVERLTPQNSFVITVGEDHFIVSKEVYTLYQSFVEHPDKTLGEHFTEQSLSIALIAQLTSPLMEQKAIILTDAPSDEERRVGVYKTFNMKVSYHILGDIMQ